MKILLKFFITLCLMVTFQSMCISQSSSRRNKIYKTIVFTSDAGGKIKGTLKDVSEYNLIIISNSEPITIPSTSIQTIRIKCANCTGRDALIGGLVGAAIGIGAGFASGDDDPSDLIGFTAAEKALMGGFALGATGALIGTLVSISAKENIEIQGDQRIYTKNLLTLKKHEQMPSKKE